MLTCLQVSQVTYSNSQLSRFCSKRIFKFCVENERNSTKIKCKISNYIKRQNQHITTVFTTNGSIFSIHMNACTASMSGHNNILNKDLRKLSGFPTHNLVFGGEKSDSVGDTFESGRCTSEREYPPGRFCYRLWQRYKCEGCMM